MDSSRGAEAFQKPSPNPAIQPLSPSLEDSSQLSNYSVFLVTSISAPPHIKLEGLGPGAMKTSILIGVTSGVSMVTVPPG